MSEQNGFFANPNVINVILGIHIHTGETTDED
jgi:hypothetical protein